MKDLEAENRRLKRCMQKNASRLIFAGVSGKKVVKPSQRIEMAKRIVSQGRLSIQRAYRLFGVKVKCASGTSQKNTTKTKKSRDGL